MRCIWIAAYALLATAPVCAQTQYEPAMPRGITDSATPQSRELAAPAAPASAAAPAPQVVEPRVPRLVTTTDRHRKDADARRCLQFTSNRDIHRCANRYLPREARARLTRTKAAKTTAEPAAASAPRSKAAADIGKADLSKAAPAGKPVETAKIVPSPSSATAGEKPSATPRAAPPQQAAAPSGEKPPKWTDGAKALVKKQGDRLPD